MLWRATYPDKHHDQPCVPRRGHRLHLIPSLMVVVSLMAPAKLNRRLNIGVSIFYAVTIAAFCIGESWIY